MKLLRNVAIFVFVFPYIAAVAAADLAKELWVELRKR
jgi:hypothetical protein